MSSQPLIQVEELQKSYRSGSGDVVEALADINLEVYRGEFVALIGPSGCGKSTLLNILAGLDSPTAGSASLLGEAPRPQGDVGVLFQHSLLLPWRTVFENVLLPGEILNSDRASSERRARHLLDLVDLKGWEDRYPKELSGGMQQRVALARVLLSDPAILLLDEPFGALDELTREDLDFEVAALAEQGNKTVVMVTHNLYEAAVIADRVVVMSPRPGRIAGVIRVDIPRPRTSASLLLPEFDDTVRAIRSTLVDAVAEVAA